MNMGKKQGHSRKHAKSFVEILSIKLRETFERYLDSSATLSNSWQTLSLDRNHASPPLLSTVDIVSGFTLMFTRYDWKCSKSQKYIEIRSLKL